VLCFFFLLFLGSLWRARSLSPWFRGAVVGAVVLFQAWHTGYRFHNGPFPLARYNTGARMYLVCDQFFDRFAPSFPTEGPVQALGIWGNDQDFTFRFPCEISGREHGTRIFFTTPIRYLLTTASPAPHQPAGDTFLSRLKARFRYVFVRAEIWDRGPAPLPEGPAVAKIPAVLRSAVAKEGVPVLRNENVVVVDLAQL
jgi:hypothetical protein